MRRLPLMSAPQKGAIPDRHLRHRNVSLCRCIRPPSEIARTGSHTGRQQWSRLLPSHSARGLQALLERFGCPAVSLSEPFKDGLALLRVAEQRGLAGVVSKRHDAPYRSGECVGIGARSRRPPGARPTGSGSGCSSDHSHASPQDAARTRPAPVSASGSGALYGAMAS